MAQGQHLQSGLTIKPLCPCRVHPNPSIYFTAYPQYFGIPLVLPQTPNPDSPCRTTTSPSVYQVGPISFSSSVWRPGWWYPGFPSPGSCLFGYFDIGIRFLSLAFTVVLSKIWLPLYSGLPKWTSCYPISTDLHTHKDLSSVCTT